MLKVPAVPWYWLRLTGICNYERILNGEKKQSASCKVILMILVDIPISLPPTPSRIFPSRGAYSWALRQSLINNIKYKSTVKISNKKYRTTCKNLLIGQQNSSVNTWTAEGIIKVGAFVIITKIDCRILMQINK